MKHLAEILNSGLTVFTYQDISIILGISNKFTVKSILTRLEKSGVLSHKYHGIRTLTRYDSFEFAVKLRTPSYLSLETVLQKAGIIFQDYGKSYTLVSNETLIKNIDGIQYSYRKIRDSILFNTLGLINTGRYTIATPERAVCDIMYLSPDYYFDNPHSLDIKLLEELANSKMYPRRTSLRINKLIYDVKHRKA